MDPNKRLVLDSLLRAWFGKTLVVELQFGMSHIAGVCLLVGVSKSELQLEFDPSADIGCRCVIRFDDEVETVTVQEFSEAAESILDKRLGTFTSDENRSCNSVGKVVNVRFRSGARLIMGLVTSYGVEQN